MVFDVERVDLSTSLSSVRIRTERSGKFLLSQPLQKLLKWASSCFGWAHAHPGNRISNNSGEYNTISIFDWTLPVRRNDFLVSSEPHVGILI